jgi:hypothetical protein
MANRLPRNTPIARKLGGDFGPERSTIATPVSSVEPRDRGKIVCSQAELLLNSPR